MKEENKKAAQTPQESQTKRIIIKIDRYQNLLEALDDRKKIWRIGVSLVVVGILLFAVITLIMLSLKTYFPYSDISTTAFGTTTITDEQKKVSYFLFNTADLWANSGIEVKKGDVISIHSSGSANTAIHHIATAADKNVKREKNFGPLGEREELESVRDQLRRRYRVFPDYSQSALIMQVVDKKGLRSLPDKETESNFYYIGAQRDNIHIVNDGTLYFAVNDIVLEKPIAVKMMLDNLAVMAELERKKNDYTKKSKIRELLFKPIKNNLLALMETRKDSLLLLSTFDLDNDTIYRENIKQLWFDTRRAGFKKLPTVIHEKLKDPALRTLYNQYIANDSTFHFGGYKSKNYDPNRGTKTEMDYYFEEDYKQAWFDDNVGSFLILVEKDNRNRLSHGD